MNSFEKYSNAENRSSDSLHVTCSSIDCLWNCCTKKKINNGKIEKKELKN